MTQVLNAFASPSCFHISMTHCVSRMSSSAQPGARAEARAMNLALIDVDLEIAQLNAIIDGFKNMV